MIAIITEKDSQAQHWSTALGGMSGTYNGEAYRICKLSGHLYGFLDIKDQVPNNLKEKYGSWDVKYLPWNYDDIEFKYGILKNASKRVAQVKMACKGASEICIATDDDPTGEGQLLAWEVLLENNIKAPKYTRAYFADESPSVLQKAFINRKPNPFATSDPEYLKALFRSKWDFMSIQFTRVATRNGDGVHLLRQGRLKSPMVQIVGDRYEAINNYVKTTHYGYKFKDNLGNIYSNADEEYYADKTKMPPPKVKQGSVKLGEIKKKRTKPPAFLMLSDLAAELAKQGFGLEEVEQTYQKMYQDETKDNPGHGYLSYPRTEDKKVSEGQFNELAPYVDDIARVIGVNPAKLTHREQRKSHKGNGSHGANRPGLRIPKSMDEIRSKHGDCGVAIYDLLSRNYLATYFEDYLYESHTAHVAEAPEYECSINRMVSPGFKEIYNVSDDDENVSNDKGAKPEFGTMANVFVFDKVSTKPSKPTAKWLYKQLSKYNIGTGATQLGTLKEITKANSKTKSQLLKMNAKGVLSMADAGKVSYTVMRGSNIASLELTAKVMSDMDRVAKGEVKMDDLLRDVERLIREDIVTMTKNGQSVQKLSKDGTPIKPKTAGTLNGKEVKFSKVWGGHTFTESECEKLLNGESITIVTSKGSTVTGKLAEQTYKGRKYVGFKADFK